MPLNARVSGHLDFKIQQFVPFCGFHAKICPILLNFKSKQPETRAFKDACHITKKSCTDGETITKKKKLVTSHFKIWRLRLAVHVVLFLGFLNEQVQRILKLNNNYIKR